MAWCWRREAGHGAYQQTHLAAAQSDLIQFDLITVATAPVVDRDGIDSPKDGNHLIVGVPPKPELR
jgi:hypothetical protein